MVVRLLEPVGQVNGLLVGRRNKKAHTWYFSVSSTRVRDTPLGDVRVVTDDALLLLLDGDLQKQILKLTDLNFQEESVS